MVHGEPNSVVKFFMHHPCNASITCYISWYTAVVQGIRIIDQQEAQVLVVYDTKMLSIRNMIIEERQKW